MKLRSVGLACALLVLAACGDDDGTGSPGGGTDVDGGSTAPVDASADDAGVGGDDGDASTTPGDDAGSATSDAGTAPGPDADLPPPTCGASRIRIEETCSPAFTACGGELTGSWCYSEVCIEKGELLGQALMQPGVPAACDVDDISIIRSEGTVDGTIEVVGSTLRRNVTTEATGRFHLTRDCVIASCAVTQGALQYALSGIGTATCETSSAGGCECDITFLSGVDSSDSFTLAGNTIVLAGGRRFDYCVEDDGSLRFRETGSAIEPGIQTALPR